MREFKPNPFELSEEQKRENSDRVARQREDFIAENGTHGSDGPVVDWIEDAGLRMMDNTEEAVVSAQDMLREWGGFVLCLPSLIGDKFRDK